MKNFLFIFLTLLIGQIATAQVKSGITMPSSGKVGEFTEWTNVNVVFGDNSNATIEYRMALNKRVGIGCHYIFEVKNTSSIKLKIRVKSHYYDKLVKSHFGEEVKGTAKSGKIVAAKLIAQGCKKDKDAAKGNDYDICTACDCSFEIFVSK